MAKAKKAPAKKKAVKKAPAKKKAVAKKAPAKKKVAAKKAPAKKKAVAKKAPAKKKAVAKKAPAKKKAAAKKTSPANSVTGSLKVTQVKKLIKECGGVKSKAAQKLGIASSTFHDYLKKNNLL